ncbi:MAG: carbohydrate ABC transporter permease [Treponema sp.]|jgi:putative aldouronate transport system permease protein|nr:carbohydrate ABC transporter permease [Treponema sp.]
MKTKTGVFDVLNVSLMIGMVFIMIYPIWYCFIGAVSEGQDYMRGGVYLWPRKFTLNNLQSLFFEPVILAAFRVTIFKCIIGTGTALLFTTIVAYGMTRPNLKFKKFYIAFIMFTMFFSGGMIPYFILIRNIRLYNTFWVYIIPTLFSVWNMIIIQSFIRELPAALLEAAKMDGYGEYSILFRIVIPLSTPVLAAITLFTVVGHWNSYFDSMMYTSSPALQTIQYYLKKVITDPSMTTSMGSSAVMQLPEIARRITPQTLKLAAMAVTALPVMLIYPFLQKYFVKGMMIGSVKG